MVVSVVGGAINHWLQNVRNFTLAIVNTYGPKVYHDKKHNVKIFVEWEYEWKQMIGKTLHEPIDRMEGVACKRGGHFKGVMGFMDGAIQ